MIYPPSGAVQLESNAAFFTSNVFDLPVEEMNSPPPDTLAVHAEKEDE